MVKLVDLYELNCSASDPVISIGDPGTYTQICNMLNNASEVCQLKSFLSNYHYIQRRCKLIIAVPFQD